MRANLQTSLCLGLLLGFNCAGDTLRVTSWNLLPLEPNSAADPHQIAIPEVAATLRQLGPDVILLQGVPDWKTCGELASALKPASYKVLICSSFRELHTGAPSSCQVAILARTRAYFTWSEPWRTNSNQAGGFAFAGLRAGSQRLGIYSVLFPEPAPGDTSKNEFARLAVGQLTEQNQAVNRWLTNRPDHFVLGAAISQAPATTVQRMLGLLAAGGFVEVPPATGLEPIASPTGWLMVSTPGLAQQSMVLRAGSAHPPLTADIELDPAKIAAFHTAPVPSQAARNPVGSLPVEPQVQASAALPRGRGVSPWLAALFGAALAVVVFWVLVRRRLKRSAAAPDSLASPSPGELPSSFTVILAPHSATGEDAAPAATHPVVHLETPGPTHTHSAAWQQRALAAEHRAAHATALLERKLWPQLSHWLKQKFVRRLLADRAELLNTQQEATAKAASVEARLARIETQIQQQNQAYERRLEELTRELHAAKEENRAIIRARINQVKAEMLAARARLLAESRGPGQAS